MLSKPYLLVLVLVSTVVISGCGAFSGADKGIPDSAFVFEGTEGLVISFFDGAPPEKVFPTSRIQVSLLLENRGAVAIPCNTKEECGKFLVFSKSPVSVSENDSLFAAVQTLDKQLIGKESYVSGGKAAYTINNIDVETPSKSTSSLVFAAACYPYKTKLSASICIGTAPFTVTKEQRVCELEDLRFGSQGAPVAITKIVQSQFITVEDGIELVKPHLRVYIENVGKGIVLENSDEAFTKACTNESVTGGINASIIGKINVESVDVSGIIGMECNKGLPPFVLTGKREKDFIECIGEYVDDKLKLSGFEREDYDNNFITTFNIVLSYGYQSAASTEVEVEVIESEDEESGQSPPELPSSP